MRHLALAALIACACVPARAQGVAQCTYVARHGTVTAGGTSQVGAPANASRKGFTLRNPATATEPLFFELGASASAASWDLPPGTAFSWPGAAVPQAAINVFAATTGHAFLLGECQ